MNKKTIHIIDNKISLIFEIINKLINAVKIKKKLLLLYLLFTLIITQTPYDNLT